MHNPDFMLQLLVNLALHYPQAGRTPAQLQILAEDWAEDLAEFSPETIPASSDAKTFIPSVKSIVNARQREINRFDIFIPPFEILKLSVSCLFCVRYIKFTTQTFSLN